MLEEGHVLVLAWAQSEADVKKAEMVLRQLCAAYGRGQPKTMVLLSEVCGGLLLGWILQLPVRIILLFSLNEPPGRSVQMLDIPFADSTWCRDMIGIS